MHYRINSTYRDLNFTERGQTMSFASLQPSSGPRTDPHAGLCCRFDSIARDCDRVLGQQ